MEKDEFFTKGFNFGYLLAKHEPKLSDKITKRTNPDNQFFQGLVWGKKEFEKELVKDKEMEIQNIRDKKAKGKDLDREI